MNRKGGFSRKGGPFSTTNQEP